MYVKCPYRSRCMTGTGILRVFSLVWVRPMDLYEHLERLFQRLAVQEDCPEERSLVEIGEFGQGPAGAGEE